MIDNLALAVSHGLMLLAAWLLLRRSDLDQEGDEAKTPLRRKPGAKRPDAERPDAKIPGGGTPGA